MGTPLRGGTPRPRRRDRALVAGLLRRRLANSKNFRLTACRALLQSTLLDATTVTRAALYGSGDCGGNPDSVCFDQNRSVITSAIGVPPFPFQNRPTFQQVVELTQTLPR